MAALNIGETSGLQVCRAAAVLSRAEAVSLIPGCSVIEDQPLRSWQKRPLDGDIRFR